jgi:hypothetical protein
MRDAIIIWCPSALVPVIYLFVNKKQSQVKVIVNLQTPSYSITTSNCPFSITIVRSLRIIYICTSWVVTRILVKKARCSELNAVIIEYIEVSKHTGTGFCYTNTIALANQFCSNKMVSLGITRHPLHNIKFSILIRQ